MRTSEAAAGIAPSSYSSRSTVRLLELAETHRRWKPHLPELSQPGSRPADHLKPIHRPEHARPARRERTLDRMLSRSGRNLAWSSAPPSACFQAVAVVSLRAAAARIIRAT